MGVTEERREQVLRLVREIDHCRATIDERHGVATFGLRSPRTGWHISRLRFVPAVVQRLRTASLRDRLAKLPEVS